MIDIYIIDDVQSELDTMTSFINRYIKDNPCDLNVRTYLNSLDFLKEKNTPDVLFLDICMPQMNGMELAHKLRSSGKNCLIIFITSMAQYALEGYEVSAFDFMIKPLSFSTFSYKFSRILKEAEKRGRHTILINSEHEKINLDVQEIYYVEVRQHKLFYHTAKGIIEAWGSMAKARNEMEELGFSLCNACYLVNLKYVDKVSDDTVTVYKEPLKMSRSKKKLFLEALTSFRG